MVAYTTGTYTTGAVKAALLALLRGERSRSVTVRLPLGGVATIPVRSVTVNNRFARSSVVKISCEKKDVTHNLEITVTASLRKDRKIVIRAGRGIGVVKKKGLCVPPGSPAINPTPRRMIEETVRELTDSGVELVISAPGGEQIARRTWNPKVGIEGGISIIGTTGVMKPSSASAFKASILAQLDVLRAEGVREIIITPGNIGEQAVVGLLPERALKERVIQAGDYLGFALKEASKRVERIVVAGHPAKLAKPVEGYFQTHHTRSPHAKNIVLKFLKPRISPTTFARLEKLPTVEGIVQVLKKESALGHLCELAELIEQSIKHHLATESAVPVLLFDMEKSLIGLSRSAGVWMEEGST